MFSKELSQTTLTELNCLLYLAEPLNSHKILTMKYDNYTSNEFAGVMDKFARGRQIHNHTFMADYTFENVFYSLLGGIISTLVYIAVYPLIYIIVSIIKAIQKQ